MIKQDYIERLIQQITKLIAKVMGKDPKQALEIIDENYDSWTRFSREELDKIKVEDLLHFLLKEKQADTSRLEFLAYLLAEEAKIILKNQAKNQAIIKAKKAILLFEYVEENQGLYDFERVSYIQEIRKIIS